MATNKTLKDLALAALKIGAVKLDPDHPFLWASSYRMPIYNDNRRFLYYPEHRNLITLMLVDSIRGENIPYDIIAGVATGGIPYGMLAADRLECPFIYIRSKPKDHGFGNQIEGLGRNQNLDGKKVIVIEDLISTGGSSIQAVEAVRKAGGNTGICLSIFNYGFRIAMEQFSALRPPCRVRSLLSYTILRDIAAEEGLLTAKQIGLLDEWYEDPFHWAEKKGLNG